MPLLATEPTALLELFRKCFPFGGEVATSMADHLDEAFFLVLGDS
jgi:hypothetical protein